MRLVELGPYEVVLSVHSIFARDWVEDRFKSDLAQILSGFLGEAVDLRLIVADDINASGSPASLNSNERLDRIEARIAMLEAQAAARRD